MLLYADSGKNASTFYYYFLSAVKKGDNSEQFGRNNSEQFGSQFVVAI